MGVAKDLVLEIARSPWYTELQRAVAEGNQTEIKKYHDLISERINNVGLEVGSRMSGYDMVSIAERGRDSLRPAEKLAIYLMSSKQRRRVEQVGGFIDALRRQAEKHIPAWYNMGDLSI